MLQKYQEALKRLFDSVFHSGGGDVSFFDYLSSVGMGISLLLILLLIVVLVIGVGFVPAKGYKWAYRVSHDAINKELEKENTDMAVLSKLKSTARCKMALFWVGLVVVYIPFAIPTVLYILTLLAGLF